MKKLLAAILFFMMFGWVGVLIVMAIGLAVIIKFGAILAVIIIAFALLKTGRFPAK